MKRWTLTMTLLSGLLALASCRRDTPPAGPEAAVGEPIRIGALFAETGPASFLGAPAARTARMLTEQINAEGGLLGRPVELVLRDTGGSPERAVSFARQLIEEERVVAIIGPSTSGETMQIKDICQAAHMPLISCAAAEVIVNPVASYVFKTPQKDSQAAAWIFKTMNEMNISRIGVVSGNTGFGNAGKAQLEALAPEFGIEIAASEIYDSRATDLTDILTKVRGQNVQAVVNWSIVPAQAIVARNMRQLGMDVPLFQSHGYGNIKYVEQGGEAAEGTLFPGGRLLIVDTLPDDHPQKAPLAAYKKAYEERFNEEVSTFGGHAYDAFMIVAEAIRKAGSTERSAVRDAIESLQGFVGTGGIFNFSPEDHNGLDMDAFEMLTVRNGRFEKYSKP